MTPVAPTVVPNIPALPITLPATPERYKAPAPSAVEPAARMLPIAAVLRYVPATYPVAEVTIMPPAACGTSVPPAASAAIIGISGSGISIPPRRFFFRPNARSIPHADRGCPLTGANAHRRLLAENCNRAKFRQSSARSQNVCQSRKSSLIHVPLEHYVSGQPTGGAAHRQWRPPAPSPLRLPISSTLNGRSPQGSVTALGRLLTFGSTDSFEARDSPPQGQKPYQTAPTLSTSPLPR